jgi:hypothetical protein
LEVYLSGLKTMPKQDNTTWSATLFPYNRQVDRMFTLGSKDGALRAALRCLVCEKGRISAIGELAILDLYPQWKFRQRTQVSGGQNGTYGELLWSSDVRATAKGVSFECADAFARLQGERVI